MTLTSKVGLFAYQVLNGKLIVPAGCENNSVRYCSVSTPFATYNESNWLDVLPDELAQQLSGLPEERLRAFYLYRVQRYTQKEIAVKFHKSQVAAHFWIQQIAEIIVNIKSNL